MSLYKGECDDILTVAQLMKRLSNYDPAKRVRMFWELSDDESCINLKLTICDERNNPTTDEIMREDYC